VRLNTTVRGVAPPQLLRRFGWWLATQPNGSVGRFDLDWTCAADDDDLYCFATLRGRARMAMRGASQAAPIIFIDQAGHTRTIATCLGAFLHDLAARRLAIASFAGDEAALAALATWLRLNRVRRR
jgi:hypothetical protein